MKITGMFPDPTWTITPDKYDLTQFVKNGDKWKGTSWVSGPWAFSSDVRAILSNHSNLSTSGFSGYHAGPYSVRFEGQPSPTVPRKILEGPRIKTNNRPFLKRKLNGDIVVSSFARIDAYLTYTNGGLFQPSGARQHKLHPTSMLPAYGFTSGHLNHGSAKSVYKGSNVTQIAGYLNVAYIQASRTDDKTPYDVGWRDDVIQDFLNNFESKLDASALSNIVMENYSNANSATVDILTSLAELPETVISALDGCKTILRLYKDAKKGELRWGNKATKVRYDREEYIRREQYETRKAYLAARNERTRRLIKKQSAARIRQIEADSKKQLIEIADAITGVWLNFRYNIMPNVYLIEDCVKAQETWGQMYRRWSEYELMELDAPSCPGFTCDSKVNIEVRSFVKRAFKQNTRFSSFFRNFSFNIFKTAYELIPLSFVLDWVIPVGNFLSASLSGNQSDYTEGCTISYKFSNVKLLYTHEPTRCQVEVTISGYKRLKINPSDYCRLILSPNITTVRQYDAIALSWRLFKGDTLKHL